ncbi:MAG: magnesium and cobalt transport protein CorA [Desulfuromonas sp.]|nr:MAG: magnesium and cobalt transport protein CorA [Desulfuromonas sp.]
MSKQPSKQVGLPPGSLVHVGEIRVEQPVLSLIQYDENNFSRQDDVTLEQCLNINTETGVNWINLCGIHDIELLRTLGERFDIHPLALEDVLNTTHRPKTEVYDHYLLVILKMISFSHAEQRIDIEQMSFVVGQNLLLSFQERQGDVFDAVRDRLQRANGRIRSRGADYLLYTLLDSIVDHYFHVLEHLDERLANFEQELISESAVDSMNQIHYFSKELLQLRKAVWPLRDLVVQMQNDDSGLIRESTDLFLRDLYDHAIQAIDSVDALRDTASSLLNLHMSISGNRMNEVMKVLTIMASIFIPLTFIAGIYGMNFEHMPELATQWGYPLVLLLMLGCVIGMVIFFKRKRWL